MRAKYLIILLIFCGSCRSAGDLIELALDRDPEIMSQYSDTITLTRLQIDSIEVEVGDTIFWEKVITETLFDTIIPLRLIQVERAKTRLEIRKAHKYRMAMLKNEKQLNRLQLRLDRVNAKLKAKTDRVEVRHDTKRERIKSRWWLFFLLGAGAMALIRMILKKVF